MLALIEDSLAVYRLTRLLTKDRVARSWRAGSIRTAYANDGRRLDPFLDDAAVEWKAANDDDPPKLAYFVTCPWCVGLWVAAGCALVRWILPAPAWAALRRVLATSAIAALVQTEVA